MPFLLAVSIINMRQSSLTTLENLKFILTEDSSLGHLTPVSPSGIT